MDTSFFFGWGVVSLIILFYCVSGFLWIKDKTEDWPIWRYCKFWRWRFRKTAF